MRFFIRSSAGSRSRCRASTSIIRSMKYDASVTRNEQRYATPPGALLVYTPSTATWAAGMS